MTLCFAFKYESSNMPFISSLCNLKLGCSQVLKSFQCLVFQNSDKFLKFITMAAMIYLGLIIFIHSLFISNSFVPEVLSMQMISLLKLWLTLGTLIHKADTTPLPCNVSCFIQFPSFQQTADVMCSVCRSSCIFCASLTQHCL